MGALQGLLDLFYPPDCLGCGTLLPRAGPFCDSCGWTVEPLSDLPHCSRCAEPAAGESVSECGRCRAKAPPFSRASAGFLHHGAIAKAIHRYKYGDHPEMAARLAHLLAQNADAFLATAPHLVCPIPLHARRLRRRAYDQTGLLATGLALRTGRTVATRALQRLRATPPQVGLDELQREKNVAGAFRAADWVKGLRMLLLDDVFTTGATARSATTALLEAGAQEVQVLALARAGSTIALQ